MWGSNDSLAEKGNCREEGGRNVGQPGGGTKEWELISGNCAFHGNATASCNVAVNMVDTNRGAGIHVQETVTLHSTPRNKTGTIFECIIKHQHPKRPEEYRSCAGYQGGKVLGDNYGGKTRTRTVHQGVKHLEIDCTTRLEYAAHI